MDDFPVYSPRSQEDMTAIVSALSQVIGSDDFPICSPQPQEDMTAIVSALSQVIGSDDIPVYSPQSNYPGVLNQPPPNIQQAPVQHGALQFCEKRSAEAATLETPQNVGSKRPCNFAKCSTTNDEDNQLQAGGGERGMMMVVEREHMFDKVMTASDVGKLNRLVIPKRHAEKYLPLDSSTKDKGLLLNFEDRNGITWTFKYCYWKSSQSYVMTTGWSRFVKDKKLGLGDIVSFQRGVGGSAKDRLFIDCTPLRNIFFL